LGYRLHGTMQELEVHDPRDTVSGFAGRTVKNLHCITNAPNKEKVHVVTHLVNSMQGLFISPYEFVDRLPSGAGIRDRFEEELNKLKGQAWPDWEKWDFRLGQSDDVSKLLWHLRNALSHRRIHFSSDSRKLEDVDIQFWDKPQSPNAPVNWHVSINGADLYPFVIQFGETIRRVLG